MDEIPLEEWATWPWTQCRARREPRTGGEYFGRCELRRGHALRGLVDHALERGFDTPRWSTDWSDVEPPRRFATVRAGAAGVGDDWTGYRVTVSRSASWGPQAWLVEVDHRGMIAVPEMALDAPPAKPGAFDLQPVVGDVDHGYAWSRAGAERKGDRIVARAKRADARTRSTSSRVIP